MSIKVGESKDLELLIGVLTEDEQRYFIVSPDIIMDRFFRSRAPTRV